MFIGLDIGNTSIDVGVFQDERLLARWKCPIERAWQSGEYSALLERDFSLRSLHASAIRGAALSCVVPEVRETLLAALRETLGMEPLTVTLDLDLGILPAWEQPWTVGIDRLLCAGGAGRLYGAPAITVGVGTAITVDVVSPDGRFLGGAIAPGLRTGIRSLASAASSLPEVELDVPERVIGTTTPSCILSGVVIGAAALVDGLVSRIMEEAGTAAPVIGTGGDVAFVARWSRTIGIIDQDLSLKALKWVYDRNA